MNKKTQITNLINSYNKVLQQNNNSQESINRKTQYLKNKLNKSVDIHKDYKNFLLNKIKQNGLSNKKLETKNYKYLEGLLKNKGLKVVSSNLKNGDILFIRHGFSCANIQKLPSESKNIGFFKQQRYFTLGRMKNGIGSDSVLTELGILQAFVSGLTFNDNGLTPYFSSSILIRTIETCFFFLLGYSLQKNINNINNIKEKYTVHLTTRYRENGISTSDFLRKVEDLIIFCYNLNNAKFINNICNKVIQKFKDCKNTEIIDALNNLRKCLNLSVKINFIYFDEYGQEKKINELKNYDQIYKYNNFSNLNNVLIEESKRINPTNYCLLVFSHSNTIKEKLCNKSYSENILNCGIYIIGSFDQNKNKVNQSNSFKVIFNKCTLLNESIKKLQLDNIYNRYYKFTNTPNDLCNNSLSPTNVSYYIPYNIQLK